MGFRIAAIITEADPGSTPFNQDVGIEQWSAPEVLKSGVISKKADVFSFAMVTVEVRRKQSITCQVGFTVSHKRRCLLEKTPLVTLIRSWSS